MPISTILSTDQFKRTREGKGKSLLEFPTDYCVVDIETTGFSPEWDAIIEIGALKFRNGIQVDSFSSLLKPIGFCENVPYLDEYIVSLTGITDDMLAVAPSTSSVISEFRNFLGTDMIIGHNVNFDVNFLYDKSINCGLPPLSNNFVDTMRISKRLHPEFPHHKLADLADYYCVDTSGAHRALVDVTITAKCYLCIQQEINTRYQSLDDFAHSKNGNHSNTHACDISAKAEIFDAENPFYNKTCVFTGTLEKMPRKDAMQIVADLGGINADTVTKKTNFLILGNNDYCGSIKDGKSSKHKKAEKYKADGLDIEIIPEDVFYDMISDFLSDNTGCQKCETDNEYTSFKNSTERDEFLKKYKLLSQNPRKEKIFYYKGRYVSEPTICSILGYYREYSSSATLVIDYGQGPHFILSDYLKQMQSSTFDVNSIEEV